MEKDQILDVMALSSNSLKDKAYQESLKQGGDSLNED